jgi:PAS domain S-box-containing protein
VQWTELAMEPLMPLRNLSEQDRQTLTRNRLAAIVHSSADAIVGETLDGIITDWNPAAEQLYGYTAEEVIGRPFARLIPPERSAESAAILARVHHGDYVENVETVRWTKDGRRIEISLTVSPVWNDAGEIIATSAIIRDITDRKATEHALAASEAMLRVAFENAPIGMVLVSPDMQTLRINRALCEMLGYTADELLGTSLWTYTHPEDIELNQDLMERALRGEIDTYQFEKRYLHRDGHSVWGHLSGSLVRGDDGTPRYFISQIENITARKAADEALAASEERFRIAFADAPIGMALVAEDERVLQANRALCTMLGYSEAELVGTSLRCHTHPDDIPADQSLVTHAVTGEVESYALQKRHLRKDGQIVWASLTASCVRDETGVIRYYISQIEDITAKSRRRESGCGRPAHPASPGKHDRRLLRVGSILADYRRQPGPRANAWPDARRPARRYDLPGDGPGRDWPALCYPRRCDDREARHECGGTLPACRPLVRAARLSLARGTLGVRS